MTWPQALQEAIEQFADVFDPMERYEMLFEWSSDVNELPVDEWNDANMIHGCQSQAHVMCHLEEGMFYMRGGADAQIVQGLMAITCLAVNGRPPEEVVEIDLSSGSEIASQHPFHWRRHERTPLRLL